MSNNPRFLATFVVLLIALVALFVVTAIEPLGPTTLTAGLSTRLNSVNYPAGQVIAVAGNITPLNLTAVSQTRHWQGYYGDITGTIVLDDADNYTFYDWPVSEPKGEIYATMNSSSPTWAYARCFNFSDQVTNNVSYWEDIYNMTYNDVDGIDETFNMTLHPAFDIGDVQTIFSDTCPSTFTHVNDAFQSDKFSQVILTDNNGLLIFTTIIENDDEANNTDVVGYRPELTPDFQMLVAEDGSSRTGVGGVINNNPTTYYFYIDIE